MSGEKIKIEQKWNYSKIQIHIQVSGEKIKVQQKWKYSKIEIHVQVSGKIQIQQKGK